jgi:hypothetical protein
MTIGHDDAANALAQVSRTRRRSFELRGYAEAGDIVLAWGLVWLVCNLLTWFAIGPGANSWPIGIVLATFWSVWRGRRHSAPRGGDWRPIATAATTMVLVLLVALVAGIGGQREINAVISLFIAATYVWMGIWGGLRFAWTGLFIAALVCIGWFVDRAHLELWLGIGGGGALIATGLWLRRA